MLAPFDPATDLEIHRSIAATPGTVWRCLTEPALLEQWFCPKPWQVRGAVIEPRAGGAFHTPMFGPNGEAMNEGPGCILIAEPQKLFAFTDALGPGFRPKSAPFMTAAYILSPSEAGTALTAQVFHPDAEKRQQQEEMGFFDGWGATLAQLDALASGM